MRGVLWVVVAVGAVSAGVLSVTSAGTALDQLRAEQPVDAVARGEPGCVTEAVFTDDSGREREVDLRPAKADCFTAVDTGDRVVVYVDPDDPDTVVADRDWGISVLEVVAGLVVLGALAPLVRALRRSAQRDGAR